MTSETDAEFLDRMNMVLLTGTQWPLEDWNRLFTLARRGAAVADHERKQRAFMGDPLKGVTLPPPPAGETNE